MLVTLGFMTYFTGPNLALVLAAESVVLLECVEQQDAAGAKAAFDKMSAEGCATCHKKHKHD